MKKVSIKVFSLITACIMIFSSVQMTVSAYQLKQINFNINGNTINYSSAIINNGRTYIPVRDFSELIGASVFWDSNIRQVIISKDNINFKLNIDEKKVNYNQEVLFMDEPAMIYHNKTYAPVRFVSEALHYYVQWNGQLDTINLYEKASYIVQKDDTLAKISEKFGISIDQLKVWNNLVSDEIRINTKLYLEPTVFHSVTNGEAKPVISYTQDDLDMLARIVFAEAQDEPYDGLVAVAAVVINRVKDISFPNTIHDVIFEPYQFTPAMTGRINQVIPDQAAYKAAKEALYGSDPVKDALFFFNPNKSNSTFFSTKKFIIKIGNHSFYR